MRSPEEFDAIFVYSGPVDMRKSFSGLSHLIQEEMGKNVFGRNLFVFSNKSRNMLKAVYWRKTGFAIWGFRLEKKRFSWSFGIDDDEVVLTADQFKMLVDGCNISAMKPHSPLEYSSAF